MTIIGNLSCINHVGLGNFSKKSSNYSNFSNSISFGKNQNSDQIIDAVLGLIIRDGGIVDGLFGNGSSLNKFFSQFFGKSIYKNRSLGNNTKLYKKIKKL
ncbi:hypothetical protein DDB_G0282013 [Dictyostelium discoideum AX4]|uniref:Putative uncharacterized protein DDB_G0282013 n=1 Tax=Dictyostelium discoideum TaxID=44689 RepID=Y5087_DICDI|nr:hypothetical protein DDB_G0282013 [Dictyostelium discoideum AX4]Q54T44.1 RecName: Full=Putative uncharacterized protein DDB_G0282013 [Dictyostelium discoideum]EAL66428.1 hypothetical protein DDB_G0282013 [Dictyostelium discoideum AX4]|eukprot:XP_640407.1 hypothetical protein DDB_G0282013 [Dictyostelium discoideum AX4]